MDAGTDVGVGTRCVLFTDLVGSTEQRVRLGEERADAFRRRHDHLLAAVVQRHHGTVVKFLGDGLLATFASAADGVATAIGVQQAVAAESSAHPTVAFEVRTGLSVGDVAVEDGDVFGAAVVEAARLCAAAHGGEILAADIVRALARGRGGFVFEPLGELELKGLPEPVRACRVPWTPRSQEYGAGALPRLLASGNSLSYVGRTDVRGRLGALWEGVRAGGCATVLLRGEPGIGKTRTAVELAQQAHADGAIVLSGRCDEGLNLSYQPFVEALDEYTAATDLPELGRMPGELTRLLPDLPARVGRLADPLEADPRTEEHRLLAAAASWLVEASRDRGLLLVLDDLQWATRPTLSMMLQTIREAVVADGARLMLLGTFRDHDLTSDHPLSSLMADLASTPEVHRIALRGLSDDEVARYVEVAAGHELGRSGQVLARLLHSETAGNPFFVGEVIRHLIESGVVRREDDRWSVTDVGELSVPDRVRDVIVLRLHRLSDRANELLATAAVIGYDIDVEVLSEVADCPEDEVVDALDEALSARLLEELGPDHYRFTHALLRATLLDRLSATRRRRLHRRTAAVLERIRPADVTALAHHFIESRPLNGDAGRAVHYSLAAAAQSLSARALAEAETRFRGALELAGESSHPSGPGDQVEALIGLGTALREQGDPGYREVLLDASRRAQRLGDTQRQVQAVLLNSRGSASIVGDTDEERVAEIENALTAVGTAPHADRARLLAHLASELTFSEYGRAHDIAATALDLAQELGDRRLLGEVLAVAGMPMARLDRLAELERLAQRVIDEAEPSDDPTVRVWNLLLLASLAFTRFDLRTDERLKTESRAIADGEGLPVARWAASCFNVSPLVNRGALDQAEQLAGDALELGLALGEPDAESWWAASLGLLTTVRDGAASTADFAGAMASRFPGATAWRTYHLFGLAHAGRFEEVRQLLPEVEPAAREDSFWLGAPGCHLAEVAWLMDDAALARRILEVLDPYAGLLAHAWLSPLGPVDRYRGMLLTVLGDYDRAIDVIDRSIEACRRENARVFTAYGQLALVDALQRRSAAGDLARARAEQAEGLAEAELMGARWLADALRRAAAPEGVAVRALAPAD